MSPLIPWIPEPKFWENRNNETENKVNEEVNYVDFKDQLSELNKTLYWNVNNNENHKGDNIDKDISLKEKNNDYIEKVTWYSEEEYEEQITNPEKINENKQKALDFFYSPDKITTIINNNSKESAFTPEEKLEKFNSDEYQEDLNKVMWNFVVDIKSFSVENADRSKQEAIRINKALTLAFNKQIEIERKWKINYSEKQVEDLIVDLKWWDAFDKLDIFEEIKDVIDGAEWRVWKKQESSFTSWIESREKKNISLEDKFNTFKWELENSIKEKDNEILKQLLEVANELLIEAKEFWDVFIAAEVDILKENIQEILSEQTV